jgi:hypothetical protein
MAKQKFLKFFLLSLISLTVLLGIYHLLGLPVTLIVLISIITITGFVLFFQKRGVVRWVGFALFGLGLFALLTASSWLHLLISGA